MFIKKDGKNKMINLYSEFEWLDDACCDTIKVTCNYDIMPYIFELKNSYTSYMIANIVHLNAVTKIRMYELMKQYEKIKTIQLDVEQLKLMISSNISVFKLFHQQVLKPAIEDINKYTDIEVTYEKILKCRKVVAIKFYIAKNPTSLPKVKKASAEAPVPKPKSLEDLYKKYFSAEQFEMFENMIKFSLEEYSAKEIETATKSILITSINSFSEQKTKREIKVAFSYMNSIITKTIEKYKEKHKPKKNQPYSIDEFEKFAINYDEIQKVENTNYVFKNTQIEINTSEKNECISENTKSVNSKSKYTSEEELEYSKQIFTLDLIKMSYDEALVFINNITPDWEEMSFAKILKEEILENKKEPIET